MTLLDYKRCTKCGAVRPATSEFFFTCRSSKVPGEWLRGACKACSNEETKANYRKNPELYRRLRNEARDRWLIRNPGWACEASARWRARRYTDDPLDRLDYKAILTRDGMVCYLCGLPILKRSDLNFDHVIPLILGGEHSVANVRPSHEFCNKQKGPRLIAS